MDMLEKLNKTFAGWYESLFGDSLSDLRPKDVLREIIGAMEDCRKEGLDNRVYVPNKYILEIAFESEEERDYLLAFLDKDELESAIRKYMAQNKYFVRGPLDFTIEDAPIPQNDEPVDKLTVKCRWDIRQTEKEQGAVPVEGYVVPGLAEEPESGSAYADDEEYTVAGTDVYDASTVAPPVLRIALADGEQEYLLTKPVVTIGRSHRLNNDLVIDRDGMISKRHAKITLAGDGFVITDLDSTNGVWVNEERVDKAPLSSGDVIRIGATKIVFEDGGSARRIVPPKADALPRLVVDNGGGHTETFPLASQVTLGRALSSDLRFDDSSVSRRHAIIRREQDGFFIEDLGSDRGTEVSGIPLAPHAPMRLRHGDVIHLGEVELSFAVD